jgi:hypothetical protein
VTPILPVVPGFALEVVEYAKDQPEYLTLPAHRQPDGTVTTRWKLTWIERLRVAFGGSIWLQVLTFNRALQPVMLTAECPIMGHAGHDEEI